VFRSAVLYWPALYRSSSNNPSILPASLKLG
jgi:hypothetical protein